MISPPCTSMSKTTGLWRCRSSCAASIVVAVHLRPLHERAFTDHLLAPLFADEVVVDAVLLVPAGRAGGVADGEDRSGCAAPGRRASVVFPVPDGALRMSSRGSFDVLTCSRMRSSSAFSSTTVAAMPACCDLEPMVLIRG